MTTPPTPTPPPSGEQKQRSVAPSDPQAIPPSAISTDSQAIARGLAEKLAADMEAYALESALPDRFQAACEYFKPTEYATAILLPTIARLVRERDHAYDWFCRMTRERDDARAEVERLEARSESSYQLLVDISEETDLRNIRGTIQRALKL